jgi:hypothetical protein
MKGRRQQALKMMTERVETTSPVFLLSKIHARSFSFVLSS